jgi:phospholipid transport system substrate-binding protein
MKQKVQFVLVALMSLFVTQVVAAPNSPTAFLKAQDKKLWSLVKNTDKNQAKIVSVVGKMLDFSTLCRASLGKHWPERTEAEQKEFTDTLRALIEKNLINRLKNSKKREVTYESESVSGNNASVVTLVASGDDPRAEKIEIVYKLEKKGASWGVVDMVTDGVSLVGNYRSQFNKIITEDGWPTLLKKMKDKLNEQQ